MSYLEHWRPLAARIQSLINAGQLYAQLQISQPMDKHASDRSLGGQCQLILAEIENFANSHSQTLPPEASAALKMFLDGDAPRVIKSGEGMREARAALIFLAAIESEISYLLTESATGP
jgi:hypothetical protein